MKLNNIHGFDSIDDYIRYKLNEYSKEEKNFETLFKYMFDEADNVMVETSDGYRVNKITYGEFKQMVLNITPTLCDMMIDVPPGEMVGLYMSNSVEWLQIFWAILAAGYSPLLMNTRLSDEVLEGVLKDYSVKCVISDGKVFSVKTLQKDDVVVASDKSYSPRTFGKEVIFMSSGTTNNVKLCAYTGENFYYQVCDSVKIVEQCPQIREHYEGELKQLMLLPLCHVFGFIAVYLWFGFFSRTFVFPRDLNPQTIQRTVKKHKVTHIFAVPMVWEAVHKAAIKKIKERGENTYSRFCNVNKIVNTLGTPGDFLAKRALAEVREGLFGDSIRFLITGGSHIKSETLSFFNGIGYHLANGYGMTEIGITSVEKSNSKKILNSASIGAPFGYTEYSINSDGKLLVRGKTRASRIMQGGKSLETDYNEWFNTGDIMRREGGRYFFDGRSDDLIVGEDGENINPTITERQLHLNSIDGICVFKGKQGITVLVSVPGVYSSAKLKEIHNELLSKIANEKLSSTVQRIMFTHEGLMRPGEFKVSHRKVAERMDSEEIRAFDPRNIEEHAKEIVSGIEAEIVSCFAEALGKDASDIGLDDDFFRDLQGTSLDYFTLLSIVKTRLGIDVVVNDGIKLATPRAFAEYVKKHMS